MSSANAPTGDPAAEQHRPFWHQQRSRSTVEDKFDKVAPLNVVLRNTARHRDKD